MPLFNSRWGVLAVLCFLGWTRIQTKKLAPEHVSLVRELLLGEIRDRIPKPEKYPELYESLLKTFGSRATQ